MRNKILLVVVMLLSALTSVQAEDNPNARQARRIFNQAYQQVFGEQGATLRYDVNIIGIYKTYGTIWYKGKKSKFVDAKMNSWNDGVTDADAEGQERREGYQGDTCTGEAPEL